MYNFLFFFVKQKNFLTFARQMIEIRKYEDSYRRQWDEFIDSSKNGTFMLRRDFMEYHSDRFTDSSLLVFERNTLIAVIPASRHEKRVISHGGLTYGGIITGQKMTAERMLQIIPALRDFLRAEGITSMLMKRVPAVYHTYPADEDLYAFFRNDIHLVRRDLSSAILLSEPLRMTKRIPLIRRAAESGVVVSESTDYDTYIALLASVLKERHDVEPVHTADEVRRLAALFPKNIRLFCAFLDSRMIAGTLLFIDRGVVHTQYMANSDEGRQCGALDLIIDRLVNDIFRDQRWLDFGISTEQSGRYLNSGLVMQKEEFGARAVAYDFYEMTI